MGWTTQVVAKTEPKPKSTKREDWCSRLSATKLHNKKDDVVEMRQRIRNQRVQEASPLTESDLEGFLQDALDHMPPPRRAFPLSARIASPSASIRACLTSVRGAV